ncbi:DUF806 family protein [Paucilactobacillus sp. N302-9]
MEQAIFLAKNLIEQSKLNNLDQVFTKNLPTDAQNDTDHTIVLITEAAPQLDDYGNDDFYSFNANLEIQIFYKLDLDFSPQDLEIQLLKLFKQNTWNITEISENTLDPDTKQVTAAFFVELNQKI